MLIWELKRTRNSDLERQDDRESKKGKEVERRKQKIYAEKDIKKKAYWETDKTNESITQRGTLNHRERKAVQVGKIYRDRSDRSETTWLLWGKIGETEVE